ncbi:ATP-binding protein [Blastococcus sp. BMG 814]|uniref:ATP-binding protein n=1 Tax=Blastococcus carthaginiensis TaxID=3050034 RepID=A0ABT9I7P0_9ACTN|nr:ATP-binding protein [Blastococcus carthaginiensis]MDP5181576.1 ATP-binding protein [Blastococcus carthaginiensis]
MTTNPAAGRTARARRPARFADALLAELEVLRVRLRAAAGQPDGLEVRVTAAEADLADARGQALQPNGLDRVADGFGLSDFERAVLLLAAGPELVGAVADELTAVHGDPCPTFGLALSLLPGAHWNALTPAAPLRRWRLLHPPGAESVTGARLTVDERVLHSLLGADYLEPELAVIARPVCPHPALPDSLSAAADRVTDAWRERRIPLLQGPQPPNLLCVAGVAADRTGLSLYTVSAEDLPAAAPDRDRVLRLMERESVLAGAAWAFDVDAARGEEPRAAVRAICGMDAPVALLGAADPVAGAPEPVAVRVPRLPIPERLAAVRRALAGPAPGAAGSREVETVAGVFDLSLPDLDLAARDAAHGIPLWDACRARSRGRFPGTQVITPRARWEDLVLPEAKIEQLRALVAAVRHRSRVLHEWGFADRSGRGLGTAALFTGPSGTGKTLAAEVIAGELGLDLVVVDLSQVVSKYIGETEKNLGRVFDAAEDGAAVLLFDEADTLFGKRTEVRDSHDRYANLEVGYLLQRIESFRGLALLTTNARSALDQAFLRRLRTVVTFTYPDKAAREALWRRAFPAATPTAGLDPARLATVDLPGGGIAAAALTAAYLGAETGMVDADMVATATRWELAKSGRSFGTS